MLATLVRGHRRKFPSEFFAQMPKGEAKSAQRLAILLRIAVLLHRSRSEVPLPHIVYHAAGKSLQMEFPSGWLADHPLTRVDLETEVGYLKSAKFKLVFE